MEGWRARHVEEHGGGLGGEGLEGGGPEPGEGRSPGEGRDVFGDALVGVVDLGVHLDLVVRVSCVWEGYITARETNGT